jgi:hypothetical protein
MGVGFQSGNPKDWNTPYIHALAYWSETAFGFIVGKWSQFPKMRLERTIRMQKLPFRNRPKNGRSCACRKWPEAAFAYAMVATFCRQKLTLILKSLGLEKVHANIWPVKLNSHPARTGKKGHGKWKNQKLNSIFKPEKEPMKSQY